MNAIDVRGYADFAPLGHKVRVLREEDKGTIAWKITFRDGREKNFLSPITTKKWGEGIEDPASLPVPDEAALNSELLCYEPDVLGYEGGLRDMPGELKQGVYY
jgi:adenylylsulfate reductase subunit B